MSRVRVRWAVWGAAVTAGVAAVALVPSWLERRLTFFPTREMSMTPENLGLSAETLRIPTADGERIAAWLVPAARPLGTLLYLHGNGGSMSDRLTEVAALRLAGFSVMIFDYRGYGQSTGTPSETGIYRDTRAAWDFLVNQRSVPPDRIVLLGESLGSAAALDLSVAIRRDGKAPPGAAVLVGAFTSAAEMGRLHFPWLPVRWMLRERLDNLAAVRETDVPLLIIHGGRDAVAPAAMGRRLYEASASPLKDLLELPEAGHATMMIGGRPVIEKIVSFVRRAWAAHAESSLP